MLDENALAEGQEYLALGVLDVSPDHNILAYALDTSGDERFTLRLRTCPPAGHARRDRRRLVRVGLGRRRRHLLLRTAPTPPTARTRSGGTGSAPSRRPDSLMFEEKDERFHLGVRRTKDGASRVLSSHSKLSPSHTLDAGRPDGTRSPSWSRDATSIEYEIEHHPGFFLMLTNEDAPNFRLVASRLADGAASGQLDRGDRPPTRGAASRA